MDYLENDILTHLSLDEIIQQIKSKILAKPETFKEDIKDEEDSKGCKNLIPKSHMSSYDRAMMIIKNDDIAFNTKMRVFIIKGSKEVHRMVTLFPKQTCTCPSTGECYHIMATKLSLGMATGKDNTPNLTKLRKYTYKSQK